MEPSLLPKHYQDSDESRGYNVLDPANIVNAVPGFNDCNLLLNVWGNSMSPALCGGTVAICKEVSKEAIEYGDIYFIITGHNNRMIKYLKKSEEPGKVLCLSDNSFFDPFEININDICRLFKVVGKISRHAL